MRIEREGQYVGPADLLDWLDRAKLRKIRSVDNAHAPATQDSIRAAARGASCAIEPVFDAAHGRRYLGLVYRSAEERAACWQFITRPPT